jgi:putative endonuclease
VNSRPLKRQASERWGRRAETWAALYLMLKGFRIVVKRYKVKGGEIDLVAKRGSLVIFVEVKARATTGEALLAIDAEKERRFETAARSFVKRYPGKRRYRADAILMRPRHWPVHVTNIMALDLS